MAENLVNIINRLDLEQLQQAVNEEGKGKEESPAILSDFERDCEHALENVQDTSGTENFREKLELLLDFYKENNDKEKIYGKLLQVAHFSSFLNQPEQELSEQHRLQPSNVDIMDDTEVVSVEKALKTLEQIALAKLSKNPNTMGKIGLLGFLSRIFTPNQNDVTEESAAAQVSALDAQYASLIPNKVLEGLNQFYQDVLFIVKNNLPLLRKLEEMVSLYQKYMEKLRSEIEDFFLLSNEFRDTFFVTKVQEQDKTFFQEELNKELIASYLNMCFQYINTKIKYGVYPYPYNEIFNLAIDTLLQILRSPINDPQARVMEKIETQFYIDQEMAAQELRAIRKPLQDKMKELSKIISGDKRYSAIEIVEHVLEEKSIQSYRDTIEVIKDTFKLTSSKKGGITNPLSKKKNKSQDASIEKWLQEAESIVNSLKSEEIKKLESKQQEASRGINLLKTGNMDENDLFMAEAATDSSPMSPSAESATGRWTSFANRTVGGSEEPVSAHSAPAKTSGHQSRLQIGKRSPVATAGSFVSNRSAPAKTAGQEPLFQVGKHRPLGSIPAISTPTSSDPANLTPASSILTQAGSALFFVANPTAGAAAATRSNTILLGPHRSAEHSTSVSPTSGNAAGSENSVSGSSASGSAVSENPASENSTLVNSPAVTFLGAPHAIGDSSPTTMEPDDDKKNEKTSGMNK